MTACHIPTGRNQRSGKPLKIGLQTHLLILKGIRVEKTKSVYPLFTRTYLLHVWLIRLILKFSLTVLEQKRKSFKLILKENNTPKDSCTEATQNNCLPMTSQYIPGTTLIVTEFWIE